MFLDQSIVDAHGEEMERVRAYLFKKHYLREARGFPGVRELFQRIRAQGSRIALASSCKADEIEGYMELAGISDLVDAQTTADDAEHSKPEPDIFLAALERLEGVTPDDAIVVGDSPYDAEAASKAGIKAVGLLSGGFPEVELRQAGCIAIYKDPQDLLLEFENSPLANG
jgi:HAD superfamily hydrolase (TIGR01509 family)